MQKWRPSSAEWLFLACCAFLWLIVLVYLPPSPGGTDVYLFRDAACNWLSGKGFQTASFERSHSFVPVLYSSYTPGSIWLYAAAGKILGIGTFGATVYPKILALLADLVALFAGLRFLQQKWARWAYLVCLGVILPFGIMNPPLERPEGASFLVLVLLVLVMRKRPSLLQASLAGLLGAAAFLCEPFAGVLAVLLIAGWLFLDCFTQTDAGESPLKKIGSFAVHGVLAALLFALPVAITAFAFYQQDHQSLERFWKQATVAGVSRDTSYAAGDVNAAAQAAPVNTKPPSKLQKYKDALTFFRALGPLSLVGEVGAAIMALVWILLLLWPKGTLQSKAALALAGFACFALPFLVFPLQGNYLRLTCALFPVVLALNWASVRPALVTTAIIPLLLVANVIVALPEAAISLLQGMESRASYAHAREQVDALHEYLQQHPLDGKVVLVPTSHYFLYKDAVQNLYNVGYLSSKEDPAQIGAVVNCYASTKDFQPGTLPLPAFVANREWKRLATAQDVVIVTLLHHRLMSRNWSMACDTYVPQD
jgi:hypothetical protein